MTNAEIRIVANQIGAFIELHRPTKEPVVLGKLHESRIQEYRDFLMEKNPDMRYASFEQVIMGCAKVWLDAVRPACPEGLTLNPRMWSYNASTGTYE